MADLRDILTRIDSHNADVRAISLEAASLKTAREGLVGELVAQGFKKTKAAAMFATFNGKLEDIIQAPAGGAEP